MKRFIYAFLVAAAAAPLMLVGCSSSSSSNNSGGGSGSTCGGLGSTGPQATVDVAVGDELNDTDGVNSVFIYLDVLANTDSADGNTHPTPDIILNNFASAVGAAVNQPRAMFMTSDETTNGGDLYVSSANGEVLVWRDYVATASGADADVMLDNVGGVTDIAYPNQLLVDADDNLVVSDQGANSVFIYNNASTLTGNGGDIADVELTGSNCPGFNACINNPHSIEVSVDDGTSTGGDLYVGNGSLASNGDPLVAIYRDVNTLTTDQDPDAALTDDVSFLNLSNTAGCQIQDVHVAHNVLFVALDSSNAACGQVFIFDNADALATDALPDAILYGNDTYISKPYAMTSLDVGGTNPTLLVGSLKSFFSATDGTSLTAFTNWFDTNGDLALATGQSADVVVSEVSSALDKTAMLNVAGGALFAVGSPDAEDTQTWDLYIFRNVGNSGVCEAMAPNIIIPGSGLNSNATDDYITLYGTFGSIKLSNSLATATRNTVTTF